MAVGKTDSSLVVMQPKGAGVPFFCVHGISGLIWNYRALVQELGVNRPFYGLQAVGLDGRRQPLAHVEAMASHYVSEIYDVQPRGPYLLAGWSFGGVIALQMALELRRRGQRVAKVIMIDTGEPSRNNHTQQRDDAELALGFASIIAAALGKEAQFSDAELRPLRSFDRINFIYQRLADSRGEEAFLEQINYLFEVFKANMKALERYVPRVYSERLVLIRASDKLMVGQNPTLSWADFAGKGVDMHEVPGDHDGILQKPHVCQLALILKAHLQKY